MKKILSVSFIALIASALLFAGGASESGEDTSLVDVQEKGTFILGLDDSFPPMGFRSESGEIVGFDIDTAKEVASRLGVELVAQPIDWNSKEQELATGNIDCIWNGFTVTPEREKVMIFSEPYLRNAQVVVVRSDSPFQTLDDLEGSTIGVQAGSSAQEAIEDTPGFSESLDEVVEFRDNLTALMDLEIGGLDGVVMDLVVANYSIQTSGKDFRVLDETLTEEEYAIGFRKGDVALRDAVNTELEAMAADGTLAGISASWFGSDITVVGK